jgi:ABC-2 type transport system permease protein
MNKTALIFKHEMVTTLKRTGFIIMTLSLPVIALLAIAVALIVSQARGPGAVEITKVGYVDSAGVFTQYIDQGDIQLVAFADTDQALKAMVAKDVREYFVIPADYASTGMIARYTLEKEPAAPLPVAGAIKNFLTSNLLKDKVVPATIAVIEYPVNLVTTRLTPEGTVAVEQGGYGNLLVPGIFSIMLVLSLSFSSAYLIQGLGEEKENRLIEVLVSSVSTRQLFVGKVLGLGAAGLIQVAVWLISLPLLVLLASSVFGGFFSGIQIPANFILLGLAYFLLGYALFAVLSAATGAISPSAREGQQLASIYTLVSVAPLWFSSTLILFPNSPVWVALSIFPLTAPVVVMFRLGLTAIPAWQIVVSLVVMALFTLGMLLVAIRIFRTYLLMYGKRPGLGVIFRTLRSG